MIVASFSFKLDRSDWRTRPEHGGGAMWDLGCYGVNCSRLFARAEPIDLHARARWGESGVDMTMQIALAFPGDVLANIDCSFEAPWRCRAELVGETGRLVLDRVFQNWDGCTIELHRTTDRDAEPEIIEVSRGEPVWLPGDSFLRVDRGRPVAAAGGGWGGEHAGDGGGVEFRARGPVMETGGQRSSRTIRHRGTG